MTTADAIETIVLQEFRLRAADTSGEAARIVAAFPNGTGPGVPLLTSIDDERDVAIVRAVHAGQEPDEDPAQRETLDRLVASWQPVQRYAPRIAEGSTSPPSYYRLAVTGSGINNAEPDPVTKISERMVDNATSTPLGLLWIGVPLGSYAGLLILTGGGDDAHTSRPDPRDWPLPLSSYLGVRIYAGR